MGTQKGSNERGPSLVGSLGMSCWYKRFLFCLGCSSRPSTKCFFLTVHNFNTLVPIAQQVGVSGRDTESVDYVYFSWSSLYSVHNTVSLHKPGTP